MYGASTYGTVQTAPVPPRRRVPFAVGSVYPGTRVGKQLTKVRAGQDELWAAVTPWWRRRQCRHSRCWMHRPSSRIEHAQHCLALAPPLLARPWISNHSRARARAQARAQARVRVRTQARAQARDQVRAQARDQARDQARVRVRVQVLAQARARTAAHGRGRVQAQHTTLSGSALGRTKLVFHSWTAKCRGLGSVTLASWCTRHRRWP